MDIVIGAVSRVSPPPRKSPAGGGGFVEAKVLNVRQPRRRREGRPGESDRRQVNAKDDPAAGRVMVLLVPEGYNIPPDIASDNYRIFLRFAPKKK